MHPDKYVDGRWPLPERVEMAARNRVAAGTYQTLVFGIVDGDKSEVAAFGKLDDDKAPDGDTVYEIGSITKTFTATLLAQSVLAGRVTLDTPVAQLLPDFQIPSRDGMEITLGELGTQHSALPRLPSNLQPKDAGDPYADYDAAKLKAFLAGYQLPRDPGTTYDADPDDLGFAALDANARLWPAYQAIVLPSASLDEYVGTYKVSDQLLLKIFRANDQLLVQATGQGPIPIFPSAPNEFFARAVRASASFTRDPDGAVNGLVLHQNGDPGARKLSASERPASE